jgi:hypothetical protein
MNPVATLFLAFAMSTDAFAAAIGKGATLNRPHWREALRTGLIFGVIEALTPLIGWFLGKAAAQYVSAWDHWIAFAMLFVLGVRMVFNGVTAKDVEEKKLATHSFWLPPRRQNRYCYLILIDMVRGRSHRTRLFQQKQQVRFYPAIHRVKVLKFPSRMLRSKAIYIPRQWSNVRLTEHLAT